VSAVLWLTAHEISPDQLQKSLSTCADKSPCFELRRNCIRLKVVSHISL